MPYIVLYLLDPAGPGELAQSIVVFVLFGMPFLLAKLYFFVLLFREILGRRRPAWLNYLALPLGALILLLTVWFVKYYYDSDDIKVLRIFIGALGITTLAVEFLVIGHYLFTLRRQDPVLPTSMAWSFGWIFLGGYAVYVFTAYSSFLPLGWPIESFTPYIYFIIHGLPLLVIWYYQQGLPAAVPDTGTPRLMRLIDESGLTPRETDILKHIIRGASNQEIAESAFISVHTVRNHIYNIYKKTGIKNCFQLLAYFQQEPEKRVN